MHVRIRDGDVEEVRLRIYEPPRFFEALLRGRRFTEPPDITARICGICPVAYQMSACAAVEDACGVTVDEPIRRLRRLIYCGEWIESHALHVFMLHAPDFLGYESAVAMARDHREIVERGLRIKKAGNELIALVGGREVHPINVRVGGFWRAPGKRELRALTERLEEARELALETVRWTSRLDFPELEEDYEFVALSHPDDYPLERGRVVSSRAASTSAPASTRSTSSRSRCPTRRPCTRVCASAARTWWGRMARYALNRERLSPLAREAAAEAGLPRCAATRS